MAIEVVDVKHRESRVNLYNVPMKKWRKWCLTSRQVFNEVYSSMNMNQGLFLHPHTEKISRQQWKTVAWNAAWIAADAAPPR